MKRVLLIAAFAACKPLPPVPTLPVHASTQGPGEDTTTVMIILGWAGTLLGGGGFGGAVRVEHQYTDATTLGVELTGGRADNRTKDAQGEFFRQWLLGARGYGRTSIGGSRYADYTYGAGLAFMGSGALIAQLHAGGYVGYVNSHVEPTAQLSLALAIPVIPGRAYGDSMRAVQPPQFEPYLVFDGGAVFHPGDGNRISLDLGGAAPLTHDDLVLGLTGAYSTPTN